ncbi:MAG: transglutaminase domain-containing protein, partial [Phycisphaeraceae bacterium]|nr:transglutaminase domain-containing protein [Phycisphaeraceae bacterium]
MTSRIHRNQIIAALVMMFMTLPSTARSTGFEHLDEARLDAALALAGANRAEIARAVAETPESHRADMIWLVGRMPEADLRAFTATQLLENLRLSVEAMEAAPWRDQVPREVFLDAVLPYAVVNERRDDWRADFRDRFLPIVESAGSPAEAAALLNQKVFPQVGVKYSTKRPKADQSGLESIDAGLASCTGLSVLLIEACRATGVPARFVGVPLWSDGSGNHSWVEIWDGERWRFTGAAEPTGMDLDKGWFAGRARGAVRDDPRRAVWASTWNDSPAHFPMVWAAEDRSVRAVNVTDRYTVDPVEVPDGFGRLYVRLRDLESGRRIAAPALVAVDGTVIGRGTTRDDSFDGNDHLEFMVPLKADFMVRFELPDGELEAGQRFSRDEQMLDVETGISVKEKTGSRGKGLSRKRAEARIEQAVKRHRAMIRRTRGEEMDAKVLELDGRSMPFWYSVKGEPPAGEGRSLFISMHGGGGAPPAVNTQQWENQKRLYDPAEGVYLAPRAPTDTWNLWHQGHVDDFFDRLSENLGVFANVEPGTIYFMGYSAGGAGVYRRAPRGAARRAAAA